MSIIGPRPGDVESKDTYRQDEKDKLLIRPGITGFTQAYYRNNIGVRERRESKSSQKCKGIFLDGRQVHSGSRALL